jgi:nucleoside 2-deoxyribosyltransferase
MIQIAGGSYGEYCVEPLWNQLFGSGVRAAASLSELCPEVNLSTYISNADQVTLQSLAAIFGFAVHAEPIPRTVEFHYHHGLSRPRIIPHPLTLDPVKSLSVTGPSILRFGFIEGDAIVHGDRVVFDTQGGFRPTSFRGNGSTESRLAIVANVAECAALVSEKNLLDPESLALAVAEAEGAETVVMKRGSHGAVIATDGQITEVPAFQTDRVWAIGSGDVFSAIFAFHWAVELSDAVSAASIASLATAFYCQHKTLGVPQKLKQSFDPPPVTRGPRSLVKRVKQVYVAGPFFTMAQRWLIEEARVALREQGLEIFSPLHDVGYGASDHVAPADLAALEHCDILFAIVDGLDSGTVFEIGYARAQGKPVVVFVQNEARNRLTMLEGSKCEITNDFATAIYKTAWASIEL